MKNKPNVYSYLDYRIFLSDLYAYKKSAKTFFSYRAFARIAGLKSSNFLKLVTDGKRNLSGEAIHKFARGMGLLKAEAHFFETLVLFNQAKGADEKNLYYERILQSKDYHDVKPLEVHQYAYFSNWYFVAIRELVTLKGFQEDAGWINRRLKAKLHPEEIKRAIQILIDLRLLERNKSGQLQQTAGKVSTTPEMGSLAILNFHREMLRKAAESLEKSRTIHRDLSALTIGISKKQFERIRERMNQFRREIHAIANEAPNENDREAVYQVNLQLFNLSEVPWN